MPNGAVLWRRAVAALVVGVPEGNHVSGMSIGGGRQLLAYSYRIEALRDARLIHELGHPLNWRDVLLRLGADREGQDSAHKRSQADRSPNKRLPRLRLD